MMNLDVLQVILVEIATGIESNTAVADHITVEGFGEEEAGRTRKNIVETCWEEKRRSQEWQGVTAVLIMSLVSGDRASRGIRGNLLRFDISQTRL
jgi:hypothetical protein